MIWLYGILGFVSLCLYAFVVTNYVSHWLKLDSTTVSEIERDWPKVDVIIPFRNEAHRLKDLLSDIKQQTYPSSQVNIILVNDHSLDDFENQIELQNHIHLYNLPEGVTGKKAALEFGIQQGQGELILFTDADTRNEKDWIKTMVTTLLEKKVDMVSGPVLSRYGARSFQRYYDLELAAFMVITGGALSGQLHAMANGANMLVRRSTLPSQDPFRKDLSASGDDLFLSEFYFENENIAFCKSRDAVVHTYPPSDFGAFISQKLRWASKNRHLKGDRTKWSMAAMLVVPTLILISPILFMTKGWVPVLIALLIWLVKSLVDFMLIQEGMSFMKRRTTYWEVVVLQLTNLHITFSVLVNVLTGSAISWKGRSLN